MDTKAPVSNEFSLKTKTSKIDLSNDALKDLVDKAVHKRLMKAVLLSKDDSSETHNLLLEDGSEILARFFKPSAPASAIESEVATMRYISQNTGIPVPAVLHYSSDPKRGVIISEKPRGVNLQTIEKGLADAIRDSIVIQIAKWIIELFNLRFDTIGSLYRRDTDTVVGPISCDIFNVDGRAKLAMLDRGPWSSAKDYFLACAQRELDCLHVLFTQDASDEYKRMLEDNQLQVERSMALLMGIVNKCGGLDGEDPEFAPFALDTHAFEPENIYVDKENPNQIVSVTGWRNTTTRPLWHCTRLPRWIANSMYEGEDTKERARLTQVFRKTVTSLNPLFVRGLDSDHVRQALEDVCQYDAVKDGFFVLPTLESIAATLPGDIDVEGLQRLLDPRTDVGRVARISLFTKGPSWTSMSMGIDIDSPKSKKRRESYAESSTSPSSTTTMYRPIPPGPEVVSIPTPADSERIIENETVETSRKHPLIRPKSAQQGPILVAMLSEEPELLEAAEVEISSPVREVKSSSHLEAPTRWVDGEEHSAEESGPPTGATASVSELGSDDVEEQDQEGTRK